MDKIDELTIGYKKYAAIKDTEMLCCDNCAFLVEDEDGRDIYCSEAGVCDDYRNTHNCEVYFVEIKE